MMEVNIVKKNNCHTKAIVNKFSNAKIYLNNFIIPRSSSGRTKDSGSFNDGSNPSLGVFCFLIFHIHIFQKDFHFLPFLLERIANYNVILSEGKYLLLVGKVWDSSGKFVIYFIIPIANPSEWRNYNELNFYITFPLLYSKSRSALPRRHITNL